MVQKSFVCLSIVLFSFFSCRTAGPGASDVSPVAPEPFPDYAPKLTPDTPLDYRPALAPLLLALPEAKLENLGALLDLLSAYRQNAAAHPGRERPGRMELGADATEYVPSDEELIASEIGERIRLVVAATPEEKLRAYVRDRKIAPVALEYGRIEITHADVMGSGRYFYASKPAVTKIDLAN